MIRLHRQGLTHRDIKPQNVIFVNNRPKLADVGLIAEIRPSDRTGTYVGTPGYMPPPPAGVSPPPQWGDVAIVRERLGSGVKDILFDRARMEFPALSVQNYRDHIERTAGPMLKLVEMLNASDPERLAKFRREYDGLIAPYFEDNIVRQDYLMTRAIKV